MAEPATTSSGPRTTGPRAIRMCLGAAVTVLALLLVPTGGSPIHPSKADAAPTHGYIEVAADAQVYAYGSQPFGPSTGQALNQPVVGAAPDPMADGYWEVATDGGIFSYGSAQFFGSTGAIHLNKPIVGMAATPDGHGYWLVASDGGISAFGDAQFFGSTGAIHLNQPVVGMASTPDGGGYYMVASDGGIFAFGDARFYGSTGAIHLNKPVVGMAGTPAGGGYWMVASDGGIFSFGDAAFEGSTGNIVLNSPIVGMSVDPDNGGYWMVASDGGIFAFGGAPFLGSVGGGVLPSPIVAIAAANYPPPPPPPSPPPPPCPTPVSGPIPPPPPGKPYWIIRSSAVMALEQAGLSPTLVNFFFNNRQTFVIGNTCGGTDQPYLPDATPVYDAPSILSPPLAQDNIPTFAPGVLYDDEAWSFSTNPEKSNPIHYETNAKSEVNGGGRFLIFTPGTDLQAGQGTGAAWQNYLTNNFAGQAAPHAQYFEIQSQGLEQSCSTTGSTTTCPNFQTFVTQAAAQAAAASPSTVRLAGLTTNNASVPAFTPQDLMAAYQETRGSVAGYWLNIPGQDQFCPNCGAPQPGVAVTFLKELAASLGQ